MPKTPAATKGRTLRSADPQRAERAKERQFVTALARGLQILRCFRRDERQLGNMELAERSNLPKPTVTRLTYTLTRLGYLEYSPGTGKYALGAGVLALSYPYISGLDVREVARPLMQELADYCSATVSLGAREHMHMINLESCQGSQMFRMRMDVGSRVPHGTTAMGRAYLSVIPEEERRELFEQYRAITPKKEWPALLAGMEQAVRDYAKYGFCLSLGDWNKEVWAVGTAMTAADGSRTLALNVSGPVFAMTRDRLIKDIGPRLCALRDRVLAATGGNF